MLMSRLPAFPLPVCYTLQPQDYRTTSICPWSITYGPRMSLSLPRFLASGKSPLTSSPSPRSRNGLKTSRIVQRGRTQGRGRGSQALWVASMPYLSKASGFLGRQGSACARGKFSQRRPSPAPCCDPNLGPMTPMPSCYWLNGLGFRPRQERRDVIQQGPGSNVLCTMPRMTGDRIAASVTGPTSVSSRPFSRTATRIALLGEF